MEIIGGLFEEYQIFLYYDVSFDNTLQKIVEYDKQLDGTQPGGTQPDGGGINPSQEGKRFNYHVNTDKVSEFRTHNISKGRNHCIHHVNTCCAGYDYFIMMDCDDVCSQPVRPDVMSAALARNDWDALSFNKPNYYDLWALSIRPYIFSCHHFNNGCALWKNYINTILKNTKTTDLIMCSSAFNGFAIYRANKFINCNYDGRFRTDYIPSKLLRENVRHIGRINYSQNKEDCEHRHFHFQAIKLNDARIRISPLCLFY